MAWGVNAIHATDIITRHVRGGETIENFHSLDLYRDAACLTQHGEPTSATTRADLLKSWAFLGLPRVQQFAVGGGRTHPCLISQIVRLCLFSGIEPFFIPVHEAKRNYQVERFHGLWVSGLWSRREFAHLAHVQAEAPAFDPWYNHH